MQATFRGTKAQLRGFLTRLPRMLAGTLPDETDGGVRAFWVRAGLAALAVIRDAYVVKARGGTDASGLKWPELAESTITRRLRKAGLPSRWRAMKNVQSAYGTVARTGRGWKKLERAKATAAKSFGPVEILRDTDRLFNSLGPQLVKNLDQVFQVNPGSVSVGTNVEYGAYHHNGTSRIPQRRLWPDWDQWPTEWKEQVFDAMREGLQDLIQRWCQGGRR